MSLHEQWVWKAEPDSPSGSSIGEAEDDWISIDDKSSTLINDVLDPELYDENPTRAQVASKLLEQLDKLVKEEPLPGWFEDRVESLFDELSSECIQSKSIVYPQPQVQSTPSFLQEFETVFGGVESCHQIYPSGSSALTPPQSPPMINTDQLSIDTQQIFVGLEPTTLSSPNIEFVYPSTDNNSIITTTVDHINQQPLQQQLHIIQEESIDKDGSSYLGQISGEWNAENVSLSLAGDIAGDVASELAAVDEYVRSCAESISPSSPVNSTVSSYLSSEDSVDDPDWTIDSCTSSSKASSSNSNYGKRNQKVTRNRRKPYSRPTEDKKVRKKEQNKNAATRYRMKKKLEVKEIVGEQQELEDTNNKLKDQVSELKREIGYLKGLMRDLFKAKGLIN